MQTQVIPASFAAPADRYIDDREAADLLGVSAGHLRNLRVKGGGPVFYTAPGGRLVRYLASDLHAWMRSLPATSTSERAA